MSDEQWGKGSLLEPPVIRHEAEQQIRIEMPPEIEVKEVMAPQIPDQPQGGAHLGIENPQPTEDGERQGEATPAHAAADAMAMAMALYFLHELHAPDRKGYEHLPGHPAGRPERDDEDAEAAD